MKFKSTFLFVAFILLMTSCSSTKNTQNTEILTQGGDPELMADQETIALISPLNLSDEQIPRVKKINLNYINKTQELRQLAEGDKNIMKSLKETLNKEKNSEMRLILTENQYKKYLGMQTGNQKRQGGRSGKRGGGGRGRRGG